MEDFLGYPPYYHKSIHQILFCFVSLSARVRKGLMMFSLVGGTIQSAMPTASSV